MIVAHRFIGGIRRGNMRFSPCSGRLKADTRSPFSQPSASRIRFCFRRDPTDELVAFVIRCLLITHHSLLITFLIASATLVGSGVFGIQSVTPALRERV